MNVLKIIIFFFALCLLNNYLFAQTEWTPLTNLYGGNILAVEVDPDDPNSIYLGTDGGGFFYSPDAGKTWIVKNDSLKNWEIYSLMVITINGIKQIWAGTAAGIYSLIIQETGIQKNDTSTWKNIYGDLNNIKITKLRRSYDEVNSKVNAYAIGINSMSLLYKLHTNGSIELYEINLMKNNLKLCNIWDILSHPNDKIRILIGTDDGLFIDQAGEFYDKYLFPDTTIFTIAARTGCYPTSNPISYFIGTNFGGKYSTSPDLAYWTSFLTSVQIRLLVPSVFTTANNCFAFIESKIYFFNEYNKQGNPIWTEKNNYPLKRLINNDIAISEYSTYLATNGGIFKSISNGNLWSPLNSNALNSLRISDLIYDKDGIYDLSVASKYQVNYYNTKTDQVDFSNQKENYFDDPITSIVKTSTKQIMIGTKNKYVLKKSDSGWQPISDYFLDPNITILASNNLNSEIYAGTSKSGIYKSIEPWITFNSFNDDLTKNKHVVDIVVDDNIYFASKNSVYQRIQEKWELTAPLEENITINSLSISTKNPKIPFTGTNSGILHLENGVWDQYSAFLLNDTDIGETQKIYILPTISQYNGILYVLAENVSKKNQLIFRNIVGEKYTQELKELPNYPFQVHRTFSVDENNPNIVYLGTDGSGVYKSSFPISQEPSFAPLSLFFGKVCAGNNSPPKDLEIMNDDKFMPYVISSVAPLPNYYSINLKPDEKVLPDTHLILNISFKPPSKEFGNFTETLILNYSDIFQNHLIEQPKKITLSGVSMYGELDINPSEERNDTITIPCTSHVNVSIEIKLPWSNYGNCELKDFKYFGLEPPFSLDSLPKSIKQNQTGELLVHFIPSKIGRIENALSISYNFVFENRSYPGTKKTINLMGYGTAGILNANENNIDFGYIPKYSESNPENIILTNTGNIPLTIKKRDIKYTSNNGEMNATFIKKDNLLNSLKLEINQACTLKYVFKPETTEKYDADLIIEYQDSRSDTAYNCVIHFVGKGELNPFNLTPAIIVDYETVHREKLPKTENLMLTESCDNVIEVSIDDLYTNHPFFNVISRKEFLIPNQQSESVIIELKKFDSSESLGKLNATLFIKFHYLIGGARCDATYPMPLIANVVSAVPLLNPTLWNSEQRTHTGYPDLTTFDLENKGNLAFSFTLIKPATSFFYFDPSTIETESILPGQKIPVKIFFKADDINSHPDRFQIKCTDNYQPPPCLNQTITVPLSGQAVGTIPTFDQTQYQCETHITKKCTLDITVTNKGNLIMQIDTNNCGTSNNCFKLISSPEKIEVNDSGIFKIEFSSNIPIRVVDTFRLCYTDSWLMDNNKTPIESTIPIIGTAYGALLKVLTIAPISAEINTLVFDPTYLGTPLCKSVQLKNIGNLSLTINKININGNHAKDYKLDTNLNRIKIDIGSTIPCSISFTPTDVKDRNATLQIEYYDTYVNQPHEEIPLTLNLGGIGLGAKLEANPASLDFQNVEIKNKSKYRNTKKGKIESIILKNIGNLNCDINSEQIILKMKSVFFKTQPHFIQKTLIPDDTIQLKIRYTPDKFNNNDDDSCKIIFKEAKTNIEKPYSFQLIGNGCDNSPPTIVLINQSAKFNYANSNAKIVATIVDSQLSLKEDNLKLYWRKSGDTNYSNNPIQLQRQDNANDSTFMGNILNFNPLFARYGIEYYIEVQDSANTTGKFPDVKNKYLYKSLPVRIEESRGIPMVDASDQPVFWEQGDYRLFSIPFIIDDSWTARCILENCVNLSYNEYTWRCAEYRYDVNLHQPKAVYLNEDPNKIIPGKSYFLIIRFPNSQPQVQLSSHSGSTIRTDAIFSLPLYPGWNTIANPWSYPLPLDNLRVGDSTQVIDSNTDGRIDSVFTYNLGWKSVKDFIRPWEGYMIYSPNIDTLYFQPDKSQPFFNSARGTSSLGTFAWKLGISVKCGIYQDNYNYLAATDEASMDYDDFDLPEPPVIGDHIQLYFPHPEWKSTFSNFAVDVRPSELENYYSDFDVLTSIANKEIELVINHINSISEGKKIYLINQEMNLKQDVRKDNYLNFNSKNGHTKHKFRILVGSKNFIDQNTSEFMKIPNNFHLFTNYPNPFNLSTNIQYTLPVSEKVTLSIYNVLGKKIKTLKKDENQEAAQYILTWDGTDDSGKIVSTGIYFIKFSCGQYQKNMKMIIIK